MQEEQTDAASGEWVTTPTKPPIVHTGRCPLAVEKKGTGWDNTLKALHIQHVKAQLIDILTRCSAIVHN